LKLTVNGLVRQLDVDESTPLLWVLRDELGLVGTKFACGKGLCGACTVHVDGSSVRSCVLPARAVAGKTVTTIEGLSEHGLSDLQSAWIEESVPQCGYCQSGQIMAAEALLRRVPRPSDAEIDGAMTNICRCGTYDRIRKAIRRVVQQRGDHDASNA
jgi:isoquinoline 1-oxidoreductase alpha subunit